MKKRRGAFFKNKYRSMLISTLISYTMLVLSLIIDSVIAGACLGEDAVSAIGIVSPYISIIGFASQMLSQGVGILFNQKLGAFKEKEAKKICGMGLILSIAIGVILMVITLLTKDIFLGFFNLTPEIYKLSMDYFVWIALLDIIYPVYYLFYNLVLDDGDNVLVTISDAVCLIANLIISVALVNSMGITGLALGTSLGNLISFLVLTLHFFSKKNMVKFIPSFDIKELKKIIEIGLPVTSSSLYAAILDIIMNKYIISNFGDMYIPAYSIANLILNACQIMAATVTAAGPQLCVYYGEKNDVGLRKSYKIIIKATYIVGLIASVLFIGGATIIPSLYGIVTPEIVRASINTCWILGITMIPCALTYFNIDYLSFVDEEKIATVGGAIFSFIGPVILAPLFAKLIGYDGIAIGLMLCPVVTCIYYYLAIKIKHSKTCKNKKELMMVLPKPEGEILDYDIKVRDNEIIELRDNIGEELLARGIKNSLVKKIQLMIEETYELIKEKNMNKGKEKRNHLSECNIIINDKYVKLVTRDNGLVFDITNANAEIRSLRCFIVASFMEKIDEKSYLLTSSFNRNSYVFEKEELK